MELEDMVSILQKLVDVPAMNGQGPDDGTLARILEGAKWMPSAGNLQPWEVVVVRDSDTKERVVQATLDPFMRDEPDMRPLWLKESPVILVFCADIKRVRTRYGNERALVVGTGDLGGFLLAFRTVAFLEGWTTGVVREFHPERLKNALGIPKFIEPVALVPMCRRQPSEGDVVDRPAMELNAFLHIERWY
jgi:nitroreductase